MLIREHYETREEWLKNRKVIGGSEAAAAVGKSTGLQSGFLLVQCGRWTLRCVPR